MRYPDSISLENGERRSGRPKFSLGRAALLVFIAAAGAVIASQIVSPTKRVIEAVAGLLLVFVLWNSSTLHALWILIIAYPFPFAIHIGNSTFVFVVVVFLIYLIRVSARLATFNLDRHFNLPIALFIMSYLVSFYNQSVEPYALRFALIHTGNMLASILLFYMVINFIDTEERLEKTMRVMMITTTAVVVFTILEMLFPGRALVPGWLYTRHKLQLIMKGVRMGGPFHDFELTAEFFAMNATLIFFMLIRSKRLLTRGLFMLLLLADLFMLFSTVTRGAFISLSVGLLYMAYVFRRDLNIVRVVSIAAAFIAIVFAIDAAVTRYTISGSLFGRVLKTTFEKGIVPENRVLAWGGALARGLKHPIIGHGPGWDFTKGLEQGLWPHNVYLFYLNITGFFGLFAFLFLLWRLWRASSLGFGSSIRRSPYPNALMLIFNVCLLIFIFDQIKIDYPRNDLYMYFIWLFFGLIAATRNIILKNERARRQAGPSP